MLFGSCDACGDRDFLRLELVCGHSRTPKALKIAMDSLSKLESGLDGCWESERTRYALVAVVGRTLCVVAKAGRATQSTRGATCNCVSGRYTFLWVLSAMLLVVVLSRCLAVLR